jgi:predicted PurR-regulated permease PerM
METTSFILGVAAVIILIMVVVAFMNYMEIKNLQKQINILQNIDEAIIHDNNALENRCIDYSNNLDKNLRDELEKLYRYIDSRTDKLETKVYKDFDLNRIQSKSY